MSKKETNSKLNWLRASVLGANDGIVSVSGIALGVAGATTSKAAILTAGIAGLVAGSLSMAAGEYTSVSSQKDTEQSEMELAEDELTNPWQAALASAVSFFLGSLIPLITIVLAPAKIRVPLTFIAVLIALTITGYVSARISGGHRIRATLRVIIGGAIAMGITYLVGHFFKVS